MPNASAAPLVAVEPTVAVVDGNHAAIVGANGLLNAFIQNHPNTELRKSPLMRMEVKLSMMLKVWWNWQVCELTYIYATNQIFESAKGLHKSLKKNRLILEILPPAAVVNFVYAQTKGKAVLNE